MVQTPPWIHVRMNETLKLPLKPLTAGTRGAQVKAKGEKEDTVN